MRYIRARPGATVYLLPLVLVGGGLVWLLYCHKVVLICCLVFVRGAVCGAMVVSKYSR